MNRIVAAFGILTVTCTACLGQSDKRKTELFTNYVARTTLPAEANIPPQTCRAIINEADRIVTSDGLKAVAKSELQIASLNLSACATSELVRFDRDLAVGLYGEAVSELERRERR